MISTLRGLGLCLLLLLTGCVDHWARPGGTPAQLAYAKQACESRAMAMFPPVLQQIMTSPGYWTPQQTNCHTQDGRTHCRTTGGYFVPPSFAMIDHNEQARDSAYRACMYSDGWILAKDKDEAAAITRSAPPPLPPPPPASQPREPRKN